MGTRDENTLRYVFSSKIESRDFQTFQRDRRAPKELRDTRPRFLRDSYCVEAASSRIQRTHRFLRKKEKKKIDQRLPTNGFVASRTFLMLQLHSSVFYAILTITTTKIFHFFITVSQEQNKTDLRGRKRNIFIYFAKDRS